MKKYILLNAKLLLYCLAFSQQFTPVSIGDIVNTPSDSRSCHFIDFDGDFFDDIFITNGPASGQNNMLYLNEGGRFRTVTNDPIVQDNGKSVGATFGDVDNDGDLDAFVTTWYGQRNFFYRNNGNQTFTFEAETANSVGTFSETAAFGDYDRDGWLDLYVTNSTDFVTNTDAIKRNQLWHNQKDGTFERISEGEIVRDPNISRSVQWVDYDQDGDTDLWLANEESEPNYLYENNNGVFSKRTDIGLNDLNLSSTGSSWGDVDNDGDLDLFVANFGNQFNQLFINEGAAGFREDQSSALRERSCSFGSAFADFDNDGDLDLFVTNGFSEGELTNFLYQNDGKGNFTKDETSIASLSTNCSYGAAWGDIDWDGYLDLVIANCKGGAALSPANTLLRNNGGSNRFIYFQLEGVQSNRSAIGSIIRVKANINGEDVWQMRKVSAQSGYCGQSSLRQHFGLGNAAIIDTTIIEWVSGARDTIANLPSGATFTLLETPVSQIENVASLLPIQLQLMPNPTTSGSLRYTVTGDFTWINHSVLEVIDVEGKQRIHQSIHASSGTLDISQLAAGIYFVRIRQRNRIGRWERISVF
ncbi:MAG: FG-GAP-like repeat-containing protein [Bacteroidota bacterium]